MKVRVAAFFTKFSRIKVLFFCRRYYMLKICRQGFLVQRQRRRHHTNVANSVSRSIDWLIDWRILQTTALIDWLIDWFDWIVDLSFGWLMDWGIWFTCRSIVFGLKWLTIYFLSDFCRIWELQRTFKGHKGAVLSFDVHPSKKLALSVGADKKLIAWDLVAGKYSFIRNMKRLCDAVVFNESGSRYAIRSASVVEIYDLTVNFIGHCRIIPLCPVTFWTHPEIIPVGQFFRRWIKSINQA